MAGVGRKGSGRPSYYYRFLGKSRLQRQRSRSRSRTRPAANRGKASSCLFGSMQLRVAVIINHAAVLTGYAHLCAATLHANERLCQDSVFWFPSLSRNLLFLAFSTVDGANNNKGMQRGGKPPFHAVLSINAAAPRSSELLGVSFRAVFRCVCAASEGPDGSLLSLVAQRCYSQTSPRTFNGSTATWLFEFCRSASLTLASIA